MSQLKPVADPQHALEVADALNAWLPCPYSRDALLCWVNASLEWWGLLPPIGPDLNTQLKCSMVREQYRDWVEAQGEASADLA